MTAQPPPNEPDDAGDGRHSAADVRDDAADERDTAADERDDAGDLRDDAADERDGVADQRDVVSRWRDVAAARRDVAADRRDADADEREQVTALHEDAPGRAEAAHRGVVARRAAAADRQLAYEDRLAGAGERGQAERDRSTSSADRDSGAAERDQAEHDRGTAGQDRGAAADDREHASLDGLTGAYIRSAGVLQLDRELLRAQRTGQGLTLAFVDVDGLKAVNDAGGHAAGDRLLVQVADALHGRLRPYDLVIRYGGDEFVCALPGMSAGEAETRFASVNVDLAGLGSVTVGVATAGEAESSADLLGRADAAMYAKRTARAPV